LGQIGNPQRVGLTAYITPGQGGAVQDHLPDPPAATWLDLYPPSGVAREGAPLYLALAYDFTDWVEEDYAARIFIRSNDTAQALEMLPVQVALRNPPVTGLVAWEARALPTGLYLEWSPAEPDSFSSFRVQRWTGDEEDEVDAARSICGVVLPSAVGTFSCTDHNVASGQRYFYRLTGVGTGGGTMRFSPPLHPLYDPPPATRWVLEPARPNPFRSRTALRVHAPAGASWELFIVDVTGRLIRRLVPPRGGRAGIHLVEWDGLRNNGTRADQGVYYAVGGLRAQRVVRPLVLIR
jgi:hypothetical protein